jgi:hypothetical protein
MDPLQYRDEALPERSMDLSVRRLLDSYQRHATAAWLALAVLLGAGETFAFRYSMNPDGIAYLDMGDAYLRGDWETAIRSHWSPLYAWLLGAALRLAQPPPDLEFPLVHLVNLGIFVLAFGAFTFLLREIQTSHAALPAWAVTSVGYAVFVLCTLQYIPLGLVTPDLLVAALVFVICGVILRMRHQPKCTHSALLGGLLGLGYLAKAPMLPLAVVFLAASALALGGRASRLLHLGVASVTLAVVAVPFIVLVSVANGRPTVGDSAMLNYLWVVDGVPLVHWQGGPDGIGQPLHHSRQLLEVPPIFAHASPFPVTYAAWYAPEYWFQGATPVFVLDGQVRAILGGLEVYAGLASDLAVVLALLAILVSMHAGPWRLEVGPSLVLLIPAVAAFGMYGLVLVEGRYVAPFLVLLVLGLLMLVRPSALVGPFSALIVAVLFLQIGWTLVDPARALLSQALHGRLMTPDDQAQVALALRAADIRPGDAVATGNRGFNAYWARLARVQIVAEVSGRESAALLEADPTARTAVQQVLLAQPVRAVVAQAWPAQTGDPGWVPIDGTDYFYYVVSL